MWKQFLPHTRIVQDGIFTFANLINSGCGLWDEPFIAPDMADITKLVLERCPNVQISIKTKGSQVPHKELPIIINNK